MNPDAYDQVQHLILDCYGCPPHLLDDLEIVESVMLKTAAKINAQILKSHFHKFAPQGVSGMVLIAESHLSIHTWPERGYAALDLFTCGTRTLPHLAPNYLKLALQVKTMKVTALDRKVLES